MTQDVTDRRIQKTRRLLKDALISLVLEKGFEAVTIQEILDRANVGRSTFYMHFENKQALLHNCFDEFNEFFEKYSPGGSNAGNPDKNNFILDLFRLVEQKGRLCKALLGKDDMMMFFGPVHEYIFAYIDEYVRKLLPDKRQAPLQLDMLANYIASALIGTLRWWVCNDMPCSAEEAGEYFKRFASQDIRNFMR